MQTNSKNNFAESVAFSEVKIAAILFITVIAIFGAISSNHYLKSASTNTGCVGVSTPHSGGGLLEKLHFYPNSRTQAGQECEVSASFNFRQISITP